MTPTERERLKRVVKEIWKSQRACAEELGIHETSLSDILSGRYPVPSALLTLIIRKGRSVDALYDTPPTLADATAGAVAEPSTPYSIETLCEERLSDEQVIAIVARRIARSR